VCPRCFAAILRRIRKVEKTSEADALRHKVAVLEAELELALTVTEELGHG
jgi:hypothetical protein